MSRLRGKCARLVALLVLIAGLLGAATPGFAAGPAPEPPKAMHVAMGCAGETHHPAQAPHLPGGDCCLANLCAMSLALLTVPSGLALPAFAERPGYDLAAERPWLGIVTTPIPHPPKSRA